VGKTQYIQEMLPALEDYINDAGLLVCGTCKTRKQYQVKLLGAARTVPVMCDCQREAVETEEVYYQQVAARKRVDALARDACTFSHDTAWREATFAKDDGVNADASAICREYVRSFATMQNANTGLLFTGPVGTGKSFLAGCVANALLAQGITVGVTSFPQILYHLRDFDKKDVLEKLQTYELLVIDDLGTERDTPYAAEQVFQVIDVRLRTQKPLLVTTNLSFAAMKEVRDIMQMRVYDRVLEMCPVHVVLTGLSRRPDVSKRKKERAAHWLLNGP